MHIAYEREEICQRETFELSVVSGKYHVISPMIEEKRIANVVLGTEKHVSTHTRTRTNKPTLTFIPVI